MNTIWNGLYNASQAPDALTAAITLAEHRLPVFPVQPSKKPYTRHGFKDASRDLQQVEEWWRQWPGAMLGIPTGAISGLVVIDVDVKDGRDGFIHLPKLDLPLTFTTSTQSGGQHFYYAYPNRKVRCSVDKIAVGIDIRGDGGYAIFPPSVGTVGQYSLDIPSSLERFPEGIGETEILEQLEILENIELSEKTEAISNALFLLSDIRQLSIQEVIEKTLPTGKGQRHARILSLARGLKFEAGLQNLSDEKLLPVVREWHRQALQHIATKPFEETWYDFLCAWPRAQLPLTIDLREWAVNMARSKPIQTPPWVVDDGTRLLFVALFYVAQQMAGDFFFSIRDIEKSLGIDGVTGWRRLKLLEAKGVIKEVKKGRMGIASRYRWIGPPAIHIAPSSMAPGEVSQ